MTTLITRYATAPTTVRKTLAWDSGLSPNRRWVPARLPSSGSEAPAWSPEYGTDTVLSFVTFGVPMPTVAEEAGIRYVLTSGEGGVGYSTQPGFFSASTMRTVVVIARPNVGDVALGTPRIFRFNLTGAVEQATSADVATCTGGAASLPALRGKWHVYAISLPAVGTTGADGVFVVDDNSTTFPYSDATWTATQLFLPASSSANGRQLRIAEVITSDQTFTAEELTAVYAKAKAWYSGLAWDSTGGS